MAERTNSLPKILFDVREACEVLMVSRTTLWKLVKSKRLQPTRIRKRLFFTWKQLTDFLDSQARRHK